MLINNKTKSSILIPLFVSVHFFCRASSYASEEFDLSHEDMIASPDEVQFDIEQEQKKKSCELLQKANKTRVNDVYLMQLARAMVVLYSRQLLATMLAKWPDDAPLITADLFGIKNGYQVSCIFDLLNGVLPKKIIDEVRNLFLQLT